MWLWPLGVGFHTVECVPAVVPVQVVDFAVEDEPAPGYSLCYAAGYLPEIRGVVLLGKTEKLNA